MVLFCQADLCCSVDNSADHKPAMRHGPHVESVITCWWGSPWGDANLPLAQALSPAYLQVPYSTESTATPLWVCVPQTGSLASGLIHVGLCPLLSPTLEQSGATGALRLASKTQGRETWGYRVMLGGVWGFLNLLFKHLVNSHTAHFLKIIYYFFSINYRNCQCFVTWEVKNCFD